MRPVTFEISSSLFMSRDQIVGRLEPIDTSRDAYYHSISFIDESKVQFDLARDGKSSQSNCELVHAYGLSGH